MKQLKRNILILAFFLGSIISNVSLANENNSCMQLNNTSWNGYWQGMNYPQLPFSLTNIIVNNDGYTLQGKIIFGKIVLYANGVSFTGTCSSNGNQMILNINPGSEGVNPPGTFFTFSPSIDKNALLNKLAGQGQINSPLGIFNINFELSKQ